MIVIVQPIAGPPCPDVIMSLPGGKEFTSKQPPARGKAGHNTAGLHGSTLHTTGGTVTQTGGVLKKAPKAPATAKTMGNGASATQLVVDGEALDMSKIKELLPDLKQQLKRKDAMLERCQLELTETRRVLSKRESEVEKLKAEVHKLKSVLQATVHKDGKPDILATIHEEATMAGQEIRSKKQGVSGESSTYSMRVATIKHYEKDFRYVIFHWSSQKVNSLFSNLYCA